MYLTLTTDCLVIRPIKLRDVYTTHEYAADIDTTKYMINLPNKSLEDTREYLQGAIKEWSRDEPSFFEFAITLNDVHIGAVSLYLNEDRTQGEIGWMLNKKYHGNGYMTEAASAVRDILAVKLGLKSLVAHCDVRNIASKRVMEKLGFTLECEQERVYPDNRGQSKEYKYILNLDEKQNYIPEQ